jgi:pyruvate dehydrogenase E2 component (dihydrolipoamide acetyltransferase)
MIEFKLPSLGADMDEGKLLEWKIRPGDTVRRGDIVAVVDTSKAAVDIECWDEGIVHELIVQPDQTIPVGTVLAVLLAPGEAPPAERPAAAMPAPAKSTVDPVPQPTPTFVPAMQPGLRPRASPAARRRATELDVDLATVKGSGPHEAITIEDIEQAAAARTTPKPAAAPVDRGEEMRRAMAAAMSRSKREIPHYYLGQTIPLRAATTWLAAYNTGRPVTERVLMAALFIKAVARACRRHPTMNGFCRDNAFTPSPAVHVGIAIALRGGGLVAPAIHDVNNKDLAALMAELADLVKRARAGSLRSSEMSDPTITVTSLGEQGADSVFGVIYPPQVALVGFGTVAERAWVEECGIFVAPCVTASLAGDHRVSSGHQGALFLAEIARLLQQPETL